MHNPLKDAISNKRRQSIDLTIVLSPDAPPEIVQNGDDAEHMMPGGEMMADKEMPEGKMEAEKGSDLAPPREESMLASKEAAKEDAMQGEESDDELLDKLAGEGSGYEGKPRSLFERASMERRQKKPMA